MNRIRTGLSFFGITFLLSCSTAPSAKFPLVEATISQLQQALNNGVVSCREVVEAYIKRIETYDQASGINAITAINPNSLRTAEQIDNAIQNGEILPELFCTPLLIKDNFDTHDMVTSGGSIVLKNNYPPDDAFMVRRLREAGAIVLAKTNMAEWAFSPRETVSSSYGRTANAYDINYVPAGSSGGTASGVAANLAIAGMGSDTGNSIRGPSSHLALFGIRSTIGLTSRDGVIPLIFDRDIAGPMTRTVEDGARLFNVVAGYDPNDPLTVPNKREANYLNFLNSDGLSGKRIGVLRALVYKEDADSEITLLFEQALQDMESAGAMIIESVSIPRFADLETEIQSCNSFRYDVGQYFKSLNSPPILDVKDLLNSEKFVPSSKSGLESFSEYPLELSPENREQACLIWPRHSLRNELLANTISTMDASNLDALVFPTWSNPPAHIDKASSEYRGDNSQFLPPSAGLPAVTVPMGFWQGRLPAGIQITGRPYSEGILIEIAYAYEQLTKHRKPPDGFDELPQ